MDAFQQSLVALPQVERLGRTRFEHIFGGATRGSVSGALAIYLTAHSSEAERAFENMFDGPIEFHITNRTETERQALHARVQAAQPRLSEAGIELTRWGMDVRTGYEHIGVLHLTDQKRDTLAEILGPWIELHNAEGFSIPFTERTSAEAKSLTDAE